MKCERLNSLFETGGLDANARNVIEDFDKIIQSVRPLNSRQLQLLPEQIRSLSHQLTDERGSRRLGYMNENVQLSAYVRYFTWWNLVRLARLFSNLPDSAFPQEDSVCLDLGSGPLTLVTALWISRPELRNKRLVWYCLDLSQGALTLGEDIYMSVAAQLPPGDENAPAHWKIIRVKGSFGAFIKEKCAFIACANMFNELDQGSKMPPEFQTKKYFEQLSAYASSGAKILLVEPGVPKVARTLSLLRQRFINDGYSVVAPCSHAGQCPMNGFKSYTGSKNKWCNFAFATQDAPSRLQKLSSLAKLPKERAVLSFVCLEKKSVAEGKSVLEEKSILEGKSVFEKKSSSEEKSGKSRKADAARGLAATTVNTRLPKVLALRITSDSFRLPKKRFGFYACSELGLTLVCAEAENQCKSGDLLRVTLAKATEDLPVDAKSGAKILFI